MGAPEKNYELDGRKLKCSACGDTLQIYKAYEKEAFVIPCRTCKTREYEKGADYGYTRGSYRLGLYEDMGR